MNKRLVFYKNGVKYFTIDKDDYFKLLKISFEYSDNKPKKKKIG